MNDITTRPPRPAGRVSTATHTALVRQLEQELDRRLLTPLRLLFDRGAAAAPASDSRPPHPVGRRRESVVPRRRTCAGAELNVPASSSRGLPRPSR